jgi:hypothetical protein
MTDHQPPAEAATPTEETDMTHSEHPPGLDPELPEFTDADRAHPDWDPEPPSMWEWAARMFEPDPWDDPDPSSDPADPELGPDHA